MSSTTPFRYSAYISSPLLTDTSSYITSQPPGLYRGRSSNNPIQSTSPEAGTTLPVTPQDRNIAGHPPAAPATTVPISATQRARRASAAEKVLEQLRSRDLQKSGSSGGSILSSPRMSWSHSQPKDENTSNGTVAQDGNGNRGPGSRRQSLITPTGPPPSPVLQKAMALPSSTAAAIRQRSTWSPSGSQVGTGLSPYPMELLSLLDGEHHTDELAVRFEAGWPVLQKWLVAAGGGAGDGDFGRIRIIYR